MERPWLGHYDQGVPGTLTYPDVPLFGLLEESARRFPNHPAIIFAGPNFSATITYRRLDALANRFANALMAQGEAFVIIGGLKVYPREIEELLHQHPKIREAVVVGVPHHVRGEQLVAQVVLKDGAAGDSREVRRDLMEFCRSRLASYKVPRRVRVVDALPKSAVGKVLRREVRDAEAARPGRES